MKQGIHPDYKKTTICSHCHPFYTGQQKILDSEGRVERFNKRYGKKA